MYKIVQAVDHRIVYASGFREKERAERWLAHYDPRQWMDKTVMVDALAIIDDNNHS